MLSKFRKYFIQSKTIRESYHCAEGGSSKVHRNWESGWCSQCLQALGDNNRFEGKYVEAKELLTQAQDEFLNIGDSRGVEECESSLSEVVTESSR